MISQVKIFYLEKLINHFLDKDAKHITIPAS